MKINLMVVHDFANYVKGQFIKAEDEIEMILAGHNHTNVVKVMGADEPGPSASPPTED